MIEIAGNIKKMYTLSSEGVTYKLPIADELINMNAFIGKDISWKYEGNIHCVKCGRKTAKSFNQGFCYPCFKNAPEAAECIIHPEKCRAHLGEGRDIEWEKKHHLQPHIVYLSLTSGVKVGVTRSTQIPTRWIDQGAHKAIILAETPNRYLAGCIEVALKEHMADKTNWRAMLTGKFTPTDLLEQKEKTAELLPEEYHQYLSTKSTITSLDYPINEYPVKVKSIGFDKVPEYESRLIGIKGQYLYLTGGVVLNIRKHTGYFVNFQFDC